MRIALTLQIADLAVLLDDAIQICNDVDGIQLKKQTDLSKENVLKLHKI